MAPHTSAALLLALLAVSHQTLAARALAPANVTKVDLLLSKAQPLLAQVSVPLNPAYQLYSYCDKDKRYLPAPNQNVLWWWENCPPIIPTDDPRIAKTAPGCSPEQVRVMWYGSDPVTGKASVLVSWATCDGDWTPALSGTALSTADATSVVRLGRAPGVYTREVSGVATSYTVSFDKAGATGGTYVTPIIHHTVATQLEPGKWFYKVEDGVQLAGVPAGDAPAYGSFSVPNPATAFPYTVGLIGDPGQVTNTSLSIDIVESAKPDLVILTGDLAYADAIADNVKTGPAGNERAFWDAYGGNMNFWAPRWDMFGRLTSPLLSRVPFLTYPGNHDAPLDATPYRSPFWSQEAKGSVNGVPCKNFGCPWSFSARQLDFNARYPAAQTAAMRASGPTLDNLAPVVAADPSSYTKNAWQRTEIAGVATVITLSEYITYDDATVNSAQYRWLYEELTQRPVNRAKTPWLIVATHAPWYATYTKHWLEAECYRKTYEPLLLWAGVDAIIEGHSHAYERSYPSADWKVDVECGIPHFMVGGGGADDLTMGYIDEMLGQDSVYGYGDATFCAGPNTYNSSIDYWPTSYAPQTPDQYGPNGWCTPPADIMCPGVQPAVSAYRQQSYGASAIKFLSPNKALFSWTSHENPYKPADEYLMLRSDARQKVCSLKHPLPPPPSASNGVSSPDDKFNATLKLATLNEKLNATLKLATLNASLASWASAGLAKPDVDLVGPIAAVDAVKERAAWKANWTVNGVEFAKARLLAKLNATA